MDPLGAEIIAIEYALPAKSVTNEELRQLHPDWDMEEVYRKTGVRQRRVAGVDECASDLAYYACRQLFESHDVQLADVNGLIVCTQSPDYIMPPTATLLQARLGLPKSVAAFDYTLACSGYMYGLAMCKAFIESGLLQSIVLVCADTYSKYIRPEDRGPATVFGDGAAATWVRRGAPGIGKVALGTDGSGAEKFIVRGGGCRNGFDLGPRGEHSTPLDIRYIEMDGFGILSFVKKEIPPFVRKLLASAGLKSEDIAQYVFHQASRVALEQLALFLRLPMDKVLINFENVGNLVSASIPIAIRDGWQSGKIRSGMTLLLAGFGVGLSWGGCVVRLTEDFMKTSARTDRNRGDGHENDE